MNPVSPAPVASQPAIPWRALFDGKSLGGWEVSKEDDFSQHGPVAVKDGVVELRKGSASTGIRWKDEKSLPRGNYELRFDARRIDGDDFFVGLTFPIDEQYCTLIVGGWGGTTVGLSNVDDQAAVNNDTTTTREFETNQWYKFRIRVSKHQVTVWIDDERIIQLPRKDRKFSIWWEQEPMRPLGIANWFTATQVRGLKVRVLSDKEIAADAVSVGTK